MIYPVQMFSARCDNCGKDFREYHNDWSAFSDVSNVEEELGNADWHIDGESDPEKHYCTDCHSFDDDDNLIIKLKTTHP